MTRLSLGSTETNYIISENNHLGAKTWPCYIEIRVIVRGVIMR